MKNDVAREMQADIHKAAVIVERKWPGVISAEDAEQEIWVRLLESDGSVRQLREMEANTRNNSLVSIGHQIASEFRAAYDLFTGQIFYCVDDVKTLLERGAITEQKVQTDTERMDLEEGLLMLREKNQSYAEAIAAEFVIGPEGSTHPMTKSRAIERLTDLMNQVHRRRAAQYESGPGSRKVRSNAAARASSKSFHESWDGRNGIH